MRLKPILAITFFVMAIGTIGFYLSKKIISPEKKSTTALIAQPEEDEKEEDEE